MLLNSETKSQRADEEGSQIEAVLMSISNEAVNGTETSQTIRLQGAMQRHEVTMLVDSGSSHCFINEVFVSLLVGAQPSLKPVQVCIANGGLLRCTQEFPCCQWSI